MPQCHSTVLYSSPCLLHSCRINTDSLVGILAMSVHSLLLLVSVTHVYATRALIQAVPIASQALGASLSQTKSHVYHNIESAAQTHSAAVTACLYRFSQKRPMHLGQPPPQLSTRSQCPAPILQTPTRCFYNGAAFFAVNERQQKRGCRHHCGATFYGEPTCAYGLCTDGSSRLTLRPRGSNRAQVACQRSR